MKKTTMQDATLLLLKNRGFSETDLKRTQNKDISTKEFIEKIQEGGATLEHNKEKKNCDRYAKDSTTNKRRSYKPP